jgi:hypothetical protein
MAAALATAAVEVGVWVGEVSDHIADVVEAVGEQLPGVLSALYAAGEPVGTRSSPVTSPTRSASLRTAAGGQRSGPTSSGRARGSSGWGC